MPRRRAFRPVWYAGVSALLISTGLFLLSFTGFGPNLGMPFGYYGKLNRIVSALDALQEVCDQMKMRGWLVAVKGVLGVGN